MSKSLGNVVVPQEVTGKLGAEILRLWVASTDYSGELSISKEILDRVVEVYRRLRELGYTGRLRAVGPLIADQFRMARRVGFDELEIPDTMAARQPEAQWKLREQGSYLRRLTA